MAEKTYPMTLAEKEKLEKELEELKLVRRPEVVERIKIARSYGDLSENSEYEAAKDERAILMRSTTSGRRTNFNSSNSFSSFSFSSSVIGYVFSAIFFNFLLLYFLKQNYVENHIILV